MTLRIDISARAEQRLRDKAAAVGQDVGAYAAGVLERAAEPPASIAQISGPVGEFFKESGVSEDELTRLLEEAKHEARARRRAS
jgi:hypothetical protein